MIYIVGMGPGAREQMTGQAELALGKSDVIIGYTVYVDLLREQYPEKEFMTTPMRREIERCRLCFEQEQLGKTVSLVCSGDAGVYGMAAPMHELLPEYPGAELCVIAGITAANTGAAELGAPLNHDYCLISLSDLLTPWEVIERRLQAAVAGDFVIALYNPESHKRKGYLKRACEILLAAGAGEARACGYVKNIGREGTETKVCTLAELAEETVDMFTTVFIGNEQTFLQDGKMVTRRGYKI